jgi:hypothetical protein
MFDGCRMSVLDVFMDEVLERILRAGLSGLIVQLASDGGLWRVDMAKFELWRG